MIKIIEAYSNKILANVEFVEHYINSNNIFKRKLSIELKTSPYKSIEKIEEIILKNKMEVLNDNKNEILLIIRNDKLNLCTYKFKLTSENSWLHLLKVNNITYYDYSKNIKIDNNILNKINTVYNLMFKINEDDNKQNDIIPICTALKIIIDNYKKTGIIFKDDLQWINNIYKKYKWRVV